MKVSNLVKKDQSIIFTGEYLDIYIPKNYFDRKLATFEGEYIKTIGLFLFDIKTKKQAEQNKFGEFHTLKFTNDIQFNYSQSFNYTGKLMNGRVASQEYKVFRLEKNDIFMTNTTVAQSPGAVIKFINALHGGQLPESIKYSELLKLYMASIQINGVDLKNPSTVFELVIAEICRNKRNLSEPFRLAIAHKKEFDEYGYKSINLKNLPSLNSTFAALSFEDIDSSVIASINRTQEGGKEKPTPIEKIIKY